MDKIFIVGHRGVGKTTLLKDFSQKSKDYVCLDLDQEIETRENVNINNLFNSGLIKDFRNYELNVLNKIIKESVNKKLIVSIGAGFELENFEFPKNSMILWVKRETDSFGRIFFSRPPLFSSDPKPDPLKDWEKIYQNREEKYFKYSNAKLVLPEYFSEEFNPLNEYLNFKAPENGFLTYIPRENDLLAKFKNLNLELRTDLISEEEIVEILTLDSKCTHLVAIRNLNPRLLEILYKLKSNKSESSDSKANKTNFFNFKFEIDWDISLGLPPKKYLEFIDIYSSHSDNAVQDMLVFNMSLLSEYKDLSKNSKFNPHYKICPQVGSHQDAINQDVLLNKFFSPATYSYLPRSVEKLDLSYFRQLKSYKQKIGFYRFANGSSRDQPLWWQWPAVKPKGFYGIYGHNIKHSYTPSFHKVFFSKKLLSPITIDNFENFLRYTDYFKNQGLKALAVTSPYKFEIFKGSNFKGTVSFPYKIEKQNFSSANTVLFSSNDNNIESFNTDYVGLKLFFNKHIDPNVQTVVWGGGALLEQIKSLLPTANFYSARSGLLRESKHAGKAKSSSKLLQATQLIWASGEKGLDPKFNKNIKITKIIDLDYRENSRARLYSFKNKIEYISGLDFFIEQAKAQQFIWEGYEF